MWIREGKPINEFPVSGEQVMFVRPGDITTGMYEWADQIIVATNAQRHAVNTYMRQIKGFGPEPQVGDKIISLRNQWEFFSHGADPSPLTNGSIGTITHLEHRNVRVPYWVSNKSVPFLYTTMIDENENRFDYIPIDYTALTTGNKFLTPQQEYSMLKAGKCPDPPFEFSYAYGITGHKSQGSEWPKVLAMEEKFPYPAEEHARWSYTVATRAEEKLVWQLIA